MSQQTNHAESDEVRLVPTAPTATVESLDDIRKTGALSFKLAAILRHRLVELCGDEHDPDGPMYPPSVMDLAMLLDEECRLSDLLEFLRRESLQNMFHGDGDELREGLEDWRCDLIVARPE